MTAPRDHFWNGWWTFTVIAASFTILMLLLEGFGLLHDWGLVLSGIGVVVTLVGGVQASTRTSVSIVANELRALHDTLGHSLKVLNKIYERLDRH